MSDPYNHNLCDETKQMPQWRSVAKTQENHKQDHAMHDGPDLHWQAKMLW